MKKVLITTTETLSGWEIQSYLKPIFSNVVVGAGFLSDFSASITDVFGGRSNSYEKKLQAINDNALKILQSKASELGANCIVGLKMNTEQISGKNVQMFMVSAYGTAVVAKTISVERVNISSKELDKSTVIDKAKLIAVLNSFNNPDYKLSIGDLQLIVDSKSSEFRSYIFKKLKARAESTSQLVDELQQQADKLYTEYFSVIDPVDAKQELYAALLSETNINVSNRILGIIKAYDLVDYRYCRELLNAESLETRKLALRVLCYSTPFYTSDDVAELKDTISLIEESFQSTASISTKKGFLSSNEKEVWNCSCGKANSMTDEYCNSCNKNQQGFRSDELKPEAVVKHLNDVKLALKDLFNLG